MARRRRQATDQQLTRAQTIDEQRDALREPSHNRASRSGQRNHQPQ
jgi:hypothetical protein